MSSPNGRALRRLVALAMLSGVVLIALFVWWSRRRSAIALWRR